MFLSRCSKSRPAPTSATLRETLDITPVLLLQASAMRRFENYDRWSAARNLCYITAVRRYTTNSHIPQSFVAAVPVAPPPVSNSFSGSKREDPPTTNTTNLIASDSSLQTTPPLSYERVKPSSISYKFVFRNFSPIDYQFSHRCVDENEKTMRDTAFLMPQIVPAVLLKETPHHLHPDHLQQLCSFLEKEDFNFFHLHVPTYQIRKVKAIYEGNKLITPTYFDPTDKRRPNQIYLLTKAFSWLTEGIRSDQLEVHTLLHDYEDLENIARTRPKLYLGPLRPENELIRIRKYFVSFLEVVTKHLEKYYQQCTAKGELADDTLHLRKEAILFCMMSRNLLANMYVRVDPKIKTVNRFECKHLGSVDFEPTPSALDQQLADEKAKCDDFYHDEDQDSRNECRTHRAEKPPLRVGNPCFVPPVLRQHSFEELPFDYELYRMARFLKTDSFKTLKTVLFEGASSVMQHSLIDVAMLEPPLVDLWRPPFVQMESTIAQHETVSKWLTFKDIMRNCIQTHSNNQVPFNQALLEDIINNTGAPQVLAQSFVALMSVPPQLIKGLFLDGDSFLQEADRAVSQMFGRSVNSARPYHSMQSIDPKRRHPLMAGLKYKMHPAHYPPPLDMPLNEFINEIHHEEKRLFNLPRGERKGKLMAPFEKRRRLAQRHQYRENIFHDPSVLCYEIFDKMPDHVIDIRQLRNLLSVEAQCGANFEKRLIMKYPQLFKDVTPPGMQRIKFERADVNSGALRNYETADDEELVQTFITAISDKKHLQHAFGDGIYSAEGILGSCGKQFSKVIRTRYGGSLEGFFHKFPNHFELLGPASTNKSPKDLLFRMPNREMVNLWIKK